MKILITGATGLIGSKLQKSLREKGNELLLTTRKEPKDETYIQWDAANGFAEPERLEGVDAVVHLAGESVSGLRWTDEKKKAIRSEEHTSELQSPMYLVCRLLLEKKKKTIKLTIKT